MAPIRARTAIDHWRVAIDGDGLETVGREIRRQAIRAGTFVSVTGFDISIHRAFEAPKYTGPAIAGVLHKVAVDGFVGEGFKIADDDATRPPTRRTGQEMLAEIKKQLPFGYRRLGLGQMSTFTPLFKDRGSVCTRNEQGAFVVLVLEIEGASGVQDDFGSLAVLLIGVGECGRSRSELRKYTASLVDEAKQSILDQLKRH